MDVYSQVEKEIPGAWEVRSGSFVSQALLMVSAGTALRPDGEAMEGTESIHQEVPMAFSIQAL